MDNELRIEEIAQALGMKDLAALQMKRQYEAKLAELMDRLAKAEAMREV